MDKGIMQMNEYFIFPKDPVPEWASLSVSVIPKRLDRDVGWLYTTAEMKSAYATAPAG